ncbi:MAG: HDOD domain-containing protein [Deltaproteobacteria bacterium]|nr:HDOD domain-containing protein [Deltaproteobacteria bacterium]
MTAQENIRKYFREVMDKHKLPPLPVVASKVLSMIEDPNLSIREICRLLADDPALAARVLAISRSLHYAQRSAPTSLQRAVQVLGLRNLRTVVIAAATQGLFSMSNNISENLWSHSLAVALACRALSERVGYPETEQAFLTGLLHDVGEMILIHGDPQGFERVVREVQQNKVSLLVVEKRTYVFDHAFIGFTLLDSWNLDPEMGQAILTHHDGAENGNPKELATILASANYLSYKAGLGFFSEPEAPPPEVKSAFGCDSDEAFAAAVQELREAFEAEKALFQPV